MKGISRGYSKQGVVVAKPRIKAANGTDSPKPAVFHVNFRTFHCEDILEFLNEVATHFDAKLQAHDEWVKKNINEVNTSEEAESIAVDGAYRWGWGMPYVLSATVFAYSYGRLEHCLFAMCKLMQEVRKATCGPEDLRDKGFIRAVNYLEKIIGIKWSSTEKDILQLIRIYGAIRNAILHNNGILRQNETLAEELISKTEGIELDADRNMELSPRYVHDAILNMSKAWDLVSCHTKRLCGLAAGSNS